MRNVAILILLLVLALAAQTSPSQIGLSPIGPAASCVANSASDVLCAASDGFYISIAGGAFQKIVSGTLVSPTTISCSTASLSTGTTGTFAASGCTLK